MDVERAIDEIVRARASTAIDPFLVCIEGFMASGKSTLAQAIAGRLDAPLSLVHADDFYGPEGRDWRSWTPSEGADRYFDHRRLESEVLQTLRSGDVANFQRYDWKRREIDDWVTIQPTGVILVEASISCAAA